MKPSHLPLVSFGVVSVLLLATGAPVEAANPTLAFKTSIAAVTEAYLTTLTINVVNADTGSSEPALVELTNQPADINDTDYVVDYAVGPGPLPPYGGNGWTELGPNQTGPAFSVNGPTTVEVLAYDNEALGDPDGNDTGQSIGVTIAANPSGSSPGPWVSAAPIPVTPATLQVSPSTITVHQSTAVTFTLKSATGVPLDGYAVAPEVGSSPYAVTNSEGIATMDVTPATTGSMAFFAEDDADNGNNMAGFQYAGAYATTTLNVVAPVPPPSPGVSATHPMVFLGRSDLPYDALVGGVLAYHDQVPLLLTPPNFLTTSVQQDLKSWSTRQVVVLGGPVAINPVVVTDLQAMGIQVTRIWGEDRYGTAAAVAKTIGDPSGTAVLTTGLNYPDALSIAAIAQAQGWPVFWANQTGIPATEQAVMLSDHVHAMYLIGSAATIGSSTVNWLQGHGIVVTRVAGSQLSNPMATEAAVLDRFKPLLNLSTLYLASDAGFWDGLTGSLAVANVHGMVMLVPGSMPVPNPLSNVLEGLRGEVKALSRLGNTQDLNTNVFTWLAQALDLKT